MELLKAWLTAEKGRGAALAKRLQVPASFITKMANGERPVPLEHGAEIEAFTQGVVSRKEIWPTDWARIWPELQVLPAGKATETANA